jgi:NADH-quinone oxidoreductase E subunit
MALEFNPEIRKQVDWTVSRYPRKEAAMLPVLHLAQKQFGYVSHDVMELVGRALEVPVNRVQDVVSFYTMFYEKPVGMYHIQVCHTLSCAVRGAAQVVEYLEHKCGVKCGEGPSTDGRFSIMRVECLGSCGTAPMMQVNDDYYENLTKAGIDELIEKWKKG